MRVIAALSLLLSLTLTGCAQSGESALSAGERAQLYEQAVTKARTAEENQAYPTFTHETDPEEEPMASVTLESIGLEEEELEGWAVSMSPMNVKAYAIVLALPREGEEDAVRERLEAFQASKVDEFTFYLPDQLQVAQNARLERLKDGTLALVMCPDQDQVLQSIRETVEGA